MQALKDARKLIERQPDGETARILSALVLALESEEIYPISYLYKLNYDDFGLALALLKEWRLDRYYTKKAVLLDLSSQVVQIQMGAASTASPALAKTVP
jgi:hypothetical protein